MDSRFAPACHAKKVTRISLAISKTRKKMGRSLLSTSWLIGCQGAFRIPVSRDGHGRHDDSGRQGVFSGSIPAFTFGNRKEEWKKPPSGYIICPGGEPGFSCSQC